MIALTQSTTPLYLRTSELYQSFQQNVNEDVDINNSNEITMIPSVNCKADETITTQEELVHLCHTLRYWGVPGISQGIMEAVLVPWTWIGTVSHTNLELSLHI